MRTAMKSFNKGAKNLDVISYATQFLVLHSQKSKKRPKDKSVSSAQKIGGWYVMSSAKKRKNETEEDEVPSWKEILEANQSNHDVYAQFARFPRNTVLPSIQSRKAREMELQRSSPRPDLYQLNNNWAV